MTELDRGRSCLVITGAPGSGKSTVARLVARHLSRAAVLDGDQINEFIVSGRVWALGEPAEETARQVALCNANLCALAANFADAEITPVIDWVIPDLAQLDFYRRALRPRSLLLVVLVPDAATCRDRDAARPPEHQFSFDGYEGLLDSMRRGFGDLGWWLDSTTLTAERTATEIIRNAAALAGIDR